VILCSWQGHAGLFPYVSEYWSLGDLMTTELLNNKAIGFNNNDPSYNTITKNLRKFFDVLEWNDISFYYQDGLTTEYFDHFDDLVKFVPALPSTKIEFSKELLQRNKRSIFIYPKKTMRSLNKRETEIVLDYKFWLKLAENLIKMNYVPVVYQNYSTYDISKDFGDQCIYITDNNILSLMSHMRATSCVLDVFSGISRLAMLARCPFVVVDERNRYVKSKEYEINDLCINGAFPYRYIMSFCNVLKNGNYQPMIDHIISVLGNFSEKLNSNKLPSSSESYDIIPYGVVRQHKEKKLGLRFIKVKRLMI
jgi:hypothetical protein